MDRDEALAFLAKAPVVRLASTTGDGSPILRTVHGVIVDDFLCFHGAPAGEKMEAIGREAVLCAEETVASIPSYFVDPQRACPATTFYQSVQVHGVIEQIDDAAFKARVLSTLMTKFQPEGGHVPIEVDHPLYKRAIEGILVLAVRLERLDGKKKVGQNRSPEERARLIERLWERGDAGDLRAIELVRASAKTPTPRFLAAPEGVTLTCQPHGDDDVRGAVAMLADAYWNAPSINAEELATAHRRSTAWVGARDASGALCATARAISDGAKHAWIYDVMVREGFRGRGLGTAVTRLLLDHPAVRGARFVWLGTRDAMPVYEKLGFIARAALPKKPYATTEMVLVRRPLAAASAESPGDSLRSDAQA